MIRFDELCASVGRASDGALFEGLEARVVGDRQATAEMLVYLAEADRRELWAAKGHSSMFAMCVERWHMSESTAAKRIWSARAACKFPVVFEMIARGEIHLSALVVLAKHLTEENHREVLERAKHKTRRKVEVLVAELAPKPDVPARIVALPQRAAAAAPAVEKRENSSTGVLAFDSAEAVTTSSRAVPPLPSGRVSPLAPRRYKIELTVGEETRDALRELSELLSHAIPSRDPAAIVERALRELLERTRAKRTATTKRPRQPFEVSRSRNASRYVPASVRREVWERDGARCAFVSDDGRRCSETCFLELHHREPFARGGGHTGSNLELRCRAHNQHAANRDYGRAFMEEKRRGPHEVREAMIERMVRIPRGRLAG